MSEWFPLHNHSHYSLLDGLSKAEQIASRCNELTYAGAALCDHGSVSGCVEFLKAMKKKGLKAILGCEFYVSELDASIRDVNNKTFHLCVLAKNLAGWQALMQATSTSHRPEFHYRKPRLDLERLATFGKGNFVSFSGHPGSELGNCLFKDFRRAYAARTYDEARSWVRDDWKAVSIVTAGKYRDLFGAANFFLEINLIDAENMPAALVIARILRWVSKQTGIPCVATADSHYARREDAEDQRILLCSAFETTLNQVQTKLDADEDVSLGGFFRSSRYHIPSLAEMEPLHEGDELKNSLVIADACETYDLSRKPSLPAYNCPDGLSPEDYLKRLCVAGWKQRIAGRVPKADIPTYQERIRYELSVINATDGLLPNYFLIEQEIVNWAINQGWLIGPGRGSAAGCLVSYLLNITGIDPVFADLMFDRFYNAGRNQPGRIALPDIDIDFPINKRELVIDHMREIWGEDRVAHIATFGRIQGRGAIKDVLRAHEKGTYQEWNEITKYIPDESKIADELQQMLELGEEPSIIAWALEHNAKELRPWVAMKEDGTLEGPYARYFAQAMRLEGTKRNQGKHASGVVISAEPLANVAPMIYDKGSGRNIIGLEMGATETIGLPKFDILGLAALDKLMGVQELMRTGRLSR